MKRSLFGCAAHGEAVFVYTVVPRVVRKERWLILVEHAVSFNLQVNVEPPVGRCSSAVAVVIPACVAVHIIGECSIFGVIAVFEPPKWVHPVHFTSGAGHFAAQPSRLRNADAACTCIVPVEQRRVLSAGIKKLVNVSVPCGGKVSGGWHTNVAVHVAIDVALLFCFLPVQPWLVDKLVAARYTSFDIFFVGPARRAAWATVFSCWCNSSRCFWEGCCRCCGVRNWCCRGGLERCR